MHLAWCPWGHGFAFWEGLDYNTLLTVAWSSSQTIESQASSKCFAAVWRERSPLFLAPMTLPLSQVAFLVICVRSKPLHTPFRYQLLGQLGLDRYPQIKVFQTGLRFGFISLSRKWERPRWAAQGPPACGPLHQGCSWVALPPSASGLGGTAFMFSS